MNEDDLRDCFAMFITAGIIMRGSALIPHEVWETADNMLEARKHKEKEDEKDIGIASVAKRKYRRKS